MKKDLNKFGIYFFIILGSILLIYFIVTQYIPFYTAGQGYGGLTVFEVNQTRALGGTIIHVSDIDLKDLPVLYKIVLSNRMGSADLNQNEFSICMSNFSQYRPEKEFRYIEYNGRIFAVDCYRI